MESQGDSEGLSNILIGPLKRLQMHVAQTSELPREQSSGLLIVNTPHRIKPFPRSSSICE